MNLVPVLVLNLLLLVITVVLVIAERFLVTYGKCKVVVDQNGEKREFTVQGGNYLLSELTAAGVKVTSSCGGKSTCGYCKVRVLDGGGPLLPTEEVFMSREEKQQGMRIACAVKVRNDMTIAIPDFLATVRAIIKNKSYDPKLVWKFITGDHDTWEQVTRERAILEGEQRNGTFQEGDLEHIETIIRHHKDMPGALSPVLQEINERFGYLPPPSLHAVSRLLDEPMTTVFRTATFYNAFSLRPRGKHIISVCLGTACHVKGASDVLAALEDELKIKAGATTPDMLFTLEGVRCIGCCGLAPVVKVGEEIHGLMSRKKVPAMIAQYKDAVS